MNVSVTDHNKCLSYTSQKMVLHIVHFEMMPKRNMDFDIQLII